MQRVKACFSVAAISMASVFAYAEHAAPVYDVDSLSSDGSSVSVGSGGEHSKSALNPVLTTASELPANVTQRVEILEQQLTNIQQSDLSNRLNSIQGQVQALRGQVEELSIQVQALRNQRNWRSQAGSASQDLTEQPAMSPVPRVVDEDAVNTPKHSAKPVVLSASAKQSAVTGRVAAKMGVADKKLPAAEQPNTEEEQAVYQTAYNLIRLKKYGDAIAALQKMQAKYPSGQFTANAHYWLGELYSLTGENERAASEFSLITKQYPSNPRVADAELKLGLINATLLKWPAAKASFVKVINKYPGTPSARLAMEQLKQLKQMGH